MPIVGLESGTTESGSWSRRAQVGAVLLLLAMLAMVAIFPNLRQLARDTWQEARGISRPMLIVIVLAKIGQAIFSAVTWRNALSAAFPRYPLPFRFMLGLDQAQDVLNALTPARTGTITLVAVLRFTIPTATTPKLLAVMAVQNLPFLVFGLILSGVIAIGLPNRSQSESGMASRIGGLIAENPLWSSLAAIALLVIVAIGWRFAKPGIQRTEKQMREGIAILGTPRRYATLIVLPAFISYAFRWASNMALLAAFEIPVTFWSTAVATASKTVSGFVRLTPGGIGPSQAIDAIALRDYAALETVTAYSLVDLAITIAVDITLALIGLIGFNGGARVREKWRARKAPR